MVELRAPPLGFLGGRYPSACFAVDQLTPYEVFSAHGGELVLV